MDADRFLSQIDSQLWQFLQNIQLGGNPGIPPAQPPYSNTHPAYSATSPVGSATAPPIVPVTHTAVPVPTVVPSTSAVARPTSSLPLAGKIDQTVDPLDLSQKSYHTLRKGTYLHFGSMWKETFPATLVGDGKVELYQLSTDLDFAADYVMRCAEYPTKKGFVHTFRVEEDIPNIEVVSIYELTDQSTQDRLFSRFCNRPVTEKRINGIVYQFPTKSPTDPTKPAVTLEYLLCDSSKLSYVETRRCEARRYFSQPYTFDR